MTGFVQEAFVLLASRLDMERKITEYVNLDMI